MTKAEEIAHWKEHYANYSDEQLIAEKHSQTENSELHIAAVQLLHERQQLAQQKTIELANRHHNESLSQEKSLHRKTQFVAWLAVIASVVGILFQVFYPANNSKNSTPSTQSAQRAPTASPAQSSISAPQAAKPPSAKNQQRPQTHE